jgi:glycosyltransferase involved in cell wall biosynthesis
LLGRRPYDQIPRYLHNADVGLIPFDVRGHASVVNTVHPLKLYEYLACGLPVVAPSWPELEAIGSPARLCRTPEEQIAAIRSAIAEPLDPSAGRHFAEAADWRGRAALLLKELSLT